MPDLKGDRKWLCIQGIDSVSELAFSQFSKHLQLTPQEREQFVRFALFAQEWNDMSYIFSDPVADLYIEEPGETPYRIPLYRFDECTLGRSRSQRFRITNELTRVSGMHLCVTVEEGQISLIDIESDHGTFINGERLVPFQPYPWLANTPAVLGGPEPNQKTVTINYKRNPGANTLTLTTEP